MHNQAMPQQATTLARPGRLCALACAGALALLLAAPASDAGAVTWRLKGAGWGHGVGMSQYGAYGFAQRGRGYKQILTHYYSNTKVGKAARQDVRVLLRPYQGRVRFRGATRGCGRALDAGRIYAATRGKGSRVQLRTGTGQFLGLCGKLLTVTGGRSVVMLGKGTYRGALQVRPSSVPGRVNAINKVGLDQYVMGVVALESPPSWPLHALRAQAVAARSFALANDVNGRGFEHYDDTRSQVYGGMAAETGRTNDAVSTTRLEVVKYKGKVALTMFFSTSGGRTEHSENVFGGKLPYLRGVKDPFDGASPYHRWTVTISGARMQAALSGLVRGKLRGIKVLKRGASPRIVRARLIGSGGNTAVSGQTLKARLGLREAWVYFQKLK